MSVAGEYDAAARMYTLHASQRTPPTPGQPNKGPVPIPIAVGLLGADGQELPLHLKVLLASWLSYHPSLLASLHFFVHIGCPITHAHMDPCTYPSRSGCWALPSGTSESWYLEQAILY